MNIHEYQAKRLFAEFGLPVSRGIAADTPEAAAAATGELGGGRWVVKAQAHAGGRGKAGGVKVVDGAGAAADFARRWLGKRIRTPQTGPEGRPVGRILVEEFVEIDRELYLGAVVDRSARRVVFMACAEGGVEIEQVAVESPGKILKAAVDPLTGPQPYQGRELAFRLGLGPELAGPFARLFLSMARLFTELDLSLLEVNPLVVTAGGALNCLDAKINADANALFRQPRLEEMRDPSQLDGREVRAARWDLSYVALDGDIGCLVNGAGLAMGTMDIVALHGGKPANFLDVGGGATAERVSEAFKIILSDESVGAVLVNIFGGIVRCDLIADGVVRAVREVGAKAPVVVRLEGNNAEKGREALEGAGLDIIAAGALGDAAAKAVAAAARTKAAREAVR